MLFRKAYDETKRWIDDDNRGLLVAGARQVGKTTLIRKCLLDNNINFVEINLLENSLALEAFNSSKNSMELMIRLTAIAHKEIDDNTVFFIDEIQEANDAITPMKFLIDDRKYKFVFSGSLLGVKLKDISSIGVGYIKLVNMYPLDFEEFAIANGVSSKTIDYLYDCYINNNKVDNIVHEQMINLFNTYLVIGGMPDAVNCFIETHNIQKVIDRIKNIDETYLIDITKYDKKDKLLIEDIYNIIPRELNAQNKRLILKSLNEKARFYQYEESFVWLKGSGVGLFTYNISNPVYPLLASKERTLFKLFLCDVGILSYKLLNGNQIKILNNEVNINYGALYEQVVAQELTCHGFPLFYSNNKAKGEIDFLIEDDSDVIPIEVKSGKDYKRHSALDNFIISYNCKNSIIFTNDNVQINNGKKYYPIYMIMFLIKNRHNYDEIFIPNISSLI